MFETVVPETFAKKSKALLYETLPISVALHAAAVIGIIVAAVWNVAFPDQSPRLVRSYNLVQIPDPPPPPPPPAPPKPQVVQPVIKQTPPVKPEEIVAPTVIPDTIPPANPQQVVDTQGVVGGIEGGVPGGVVGGTFDGVQGGDVGGTKGGTVGGVIADDRVHIERDRPLPMYPVSQVYPIYPEEARLRHYEDSLVVRYIIGKDGRVKEVIVLNHAERKIFEEAAVKAIRNWRFRPMIKDGQATEVQHELTVNFKLEPAG